MAEVVPREQRVRDRFEMTVDGALALMEEADVERERAIRFLLKEIPDTIRRSGTLEDMADAFYGAGGRLSKEALMRELAARVLAEEEGVGSVACAAPTCKKKRASSRLARTKS